MAPKLLLSSKIPLDRLQIEPDVSSLKDKRVVITGGASGLGAAFVQAYAEAGAYVTIADYNESLATELATTLKSKGFSVQAFTTDVASWPSQVAAFQSALRFGPGPARIDHVISSAGIDTGPFFQPQEDPTPSVDNVPDEPPVKVLDINAKGVVYTVRLSQYYMSIPSSENHDKAITLLTSTGAYWPIPLNGMYTASKGAGRVLFRTMRGPLAARGIRINLLAPWLTRSPMTVHLVELFGRLGYPVCDPPIVTKAMMRIATDTTIVGRSIQAGLGGITDLRDDAEGHHGGLETNSLVDEHLGGFKKLNATHEKILGEYGYVDMIETS